MKGKGHKALKWRTRFGVKRRRERSRVKPRGDKEKSEFGMSVGKRKTSGSHLEERGGS